MATGFKTGGRAPGTPNRGNAEVRAAAQEYSIAAVKRLAVLGGLVDGGDGAADSHQAQIDALSKLLDRAVGRPAQAIIPQNADETPYQPQPMPVSELARTIAFVLRKGVQSNGVRSDADGQSQVLQ